MDEFSLQEPIAFFNGEFLPQSRLALSVVDAGFVLGATVTEQLRTFGGKVFEVEEHFHRLRHSLETIGLDAAAVATQLREAVDRVATHNHRLLEPGDDLGVSVFVTPGRYLAYSGPGPVTPTLCVHTYPLPFFLWAEKYRSGQSLVLPETRQVPQRCWPAHLKCRSRMHYYLADRQAAAREPGARALLLDLEDFVTETSTANVVIYSTEKGLESPPDERTLPGISLRYLARLAEELRMPFHRRDLTADDLRRADEIFLTSTPLCMIPVTRFEGRPVGDGKPGPVFRTLLRAWSRSVGLDIEGQALAFARRPN